MILETLFSDKCDIAINESVQVRCVKISLDQKKKRINHADARADHDGRWTGTTDLQDLSIQKGKRPSNLSNNRSSSCFH